MIDRADEPIERRDRVEALRQFPPPDRAFERQPVAPALLVEVPGPERLGEFRVVLRVADQGPEDGARVVLGEEPGEAAQVGAQVGAEPAVVGGESCSAASSRKVSSRTSVFEDHHR